MPLRVTVTLIGAGTALLAGVSWRCLRQPRSHGFFRFFAFEAVLCLVVLDAPHWFHRPGAPLQILSWVLLASSLLLAVHSYLLLRRRGRPTAPEPGSPLFELEHTSRMVTTGAYRFIRHPAYASLLCLAWGAALKAPSLPIFVLGLIATAFLVATAKVEEAENLRRFGEDYREYMKRTRSFIPFVL